MGTRHDLPERVPAPSVSALLPPINVPGEAMTRHALYLTFAIFTACNTTSTAPPPTTTTTATTTTSPPTTVTSVPATVPPKPAVVEAPRARSGSAVPAGLGASDVLACIRRYESGGNYRARNAHGHSGAYQFDRKTWASVGGSGEAADAPPEEQDVRAAELYRRRGLQPWPTPSRRCR